MGPQPDLARHQGSRRLVANGVKCTSNYSELSTYHEYDNICPMSCTVFALCSAAEPLHTGRVTAGAGWPPRVASTERRSQRSRPADRRGTRGPLGIARIPVVGGRWQLARHRHVS